MTVPEVTAPARRRPVLFVATIGAMVGASATAVDMPIPAQALIAETLGADHGDGARLISAYMLTYGPANLVWGPLSDRFGRIGPTLVALVMFTAACIAAALATDFQTLVAARMVQGFSGGAAPPIARAIARDQGGGEATARLISTATVILGLAPLLAPLAGSVLLVVADWRAIFCALAGFATLLGLATLAFVPESLPAAARRPLAPVSLALTVGRLLLLVPFMAPVIAAGFIFAGYAALLAVGAAVAGDAYGVGAEAFGLLFMVNAAFFVAGTTLARAITAWIGADGVMLAGAGVAGLSAAGLGWLTVTTPDLVPLWGGVSVYVLAFGMILPAATAKALEPVGDVAGTASALHGFIAIAMGAAGAEIAGQLFAGDHVGLTLVMAASAALTAISIPISVRLSRPHRAG